MISRSRNSDVINTPSHMVHLNPARLCSGDSTGRKHSLICGLHPRLVSVHKQKQHTRSEPRGVRHKVPHQTEVYSSSVFARRQRVPITGCIDHMRGGQAIFSIRSEELLCVEALELQAEAFRARPTLTGSLLLPGHSGSASASASGSPYKGRRFNGNQF